MRTAILAAALMALTVPAFAQPAREDRGDQRRDDHGDRGDRGDHRDDRRGGPDRDARGGGPRNNDWQNGRRYDWNRPDPRGGYDASRYYRDDRSYRERRLGSNDRIYRGSDNRYYCRRSDGTTGLIVGALAGGVLGNALSSGGSGLLGTVLGAAGGGLAGRSIDRNNVRCR